MINVTVYRTANDRSPFEEWHSKIDRMARARVDIAIDKLQVGNTGALKSLGHGLHELKLTFGPGYRVYLGREGDELVILLTGGTEKRQSADIERARVLWAALW